MSDLPSQQRRRIGVTDLPSELRRPLIGRLPPSTPGYDAAIEAHEQAIEAGEPLYRDPVTGAYVFTAAAHWERGTCCGSGCRHCPFERGERADCCESGCEGCPFTAHWTADDPRRTH